MRANGWTSIREGLLFEGGFYSRVYGSDAFYIFPDISGGGWMGRKRDAR